jgi:hypothetical protein
MWFWILILFGSSMMMILYRCCTIVIPSVREYELLYRARKGKSQTINGLKKHISLSQWFILSQIGRNSKSRDFNNFLRKLRPMLQNPIGKKKPVDIEFQKEKTLHSIEPLLNSCRMV